MDREEQKRFLRAVERCPSVRDRAVALLLLYTGLRVSECAALDLDDLLLSARKGKVIVRDGKGNSYREVPLNTEVREAQKAWLQERQRRFPRSQNLALFLSRQGNDVVLVAEIAGHRRLETTRRYSLPTDQDRAAAMEALRVDY